MWDCEAYGPEVTEAGGLCFVAGELNKRVCADLAECGRAVAAERQRVWQRMNELAAGGDPTGAYLSQEFTRPDQLLGGGQIGEDEEWGL